MGRTFRQNRNDERRNARYENIVKKQTRADKRNSETKDDERIRSHNERGFLERFRKRKDPDVIRERIAAKKLKLVEQQVDTKLKKDKASRPKSTVFGQPQQTRGSRGRGKTPRARAPETPSNSILDSQPGTGLNEMFGFSSSSTGTRKKSSDGLDGLKSLFG